MRVVCGEESPIPPRHYSRNIPATFLATALSAVTTTLQRINEMPKSRYANVKRNPKAKKKDADESWSAPAMWSDDRYKVVKSAFDAVDEEEKKNFSR